MGTYSEKFDDVDVEEKAVEICAIEGRGDPFAMTYIHDEGILQPYGPQWAHYIEAAVDALEKQ